MAIYANEVGVNELLVVTPYYNKCNQNGLYEHFKQIANSVSIPIILYNVPTRTCVDISLDTLKKLNKIENIVAIKEAKDDLRKNI